MRSLWIPIVLLSAACAGVGDMRQTPTAWAEGVVLIRDAQTLFGAAPYCSRPATIDLPKVEAATPEGREIAGANVAPGSARYRLLRSAMHTRLITVCKEVARCEGFDLVVRTGDIADARGLHVGDMTEGVARVARRSR
ncbi:MAG: hypothetical protein ACI89X_003027 [Planctomycetota bacterium]|jgi:hypothetical protein